MIARQNAAKKRSIDSYVSILSCILTPQDSSASPAQQALGKDAQGVREQDARLQWIYRSAQKEV